MNDCCATEGVIEYSGSTDRDVYIGIVLEKKEKAKPMIVGRLFFVGSVERADSKECFRRVMSYVALAKAQYTTQLRSKEVAKLQGREQ
jgi:hypothetical protein